MDFNTIKSTITDTANKGISKTIEFIEKIDTIQSDKSQDSSEPKKEIKAKDAYEGEDWYNDVGTIPQR